MCVWNVGVGCNKVQCERISDGHDCNTQQGLSSRRLRIFWAPRGVCCGLGHWAPSGSLRHTMSVRRTCGPARGWANQLLRQLPRGSGGDASAVKKAGSGRQVGQPIALHLHCTASTRTSPPASMRAILCAGPRCSTTLPHLNPVHVRLSWSVFRVREYIPT